MLRRHDQGHGGCRRSGGAAPTPSGEGLPSRGQQRPLGLLSEAPRKAGVQLPGAWPCAGSGANPQRAEGKTGLSPGPPSQGLTEGKFAVTEDAGCSGPARLYETTLLRAEIKGAPGQAQWWDRKDPDDNRGPGWEGGVGTRLDTLTGVGHQMAFREARNVPPARAGTRCQVSSGMAGTGVFQKAPLPASGLV